MTWHWQVYCSLERHRGEHVTSFHLNRDDTGEFLLACSVESSLQGNQHSVDDSAVFLQMLPRFAVFVVLFVFSPSSACRSRQNSFHTRVCADVGACATAVSPRKLCSNQDVQSPARSLQACMHAPHGRTVECCRWLCTVATAPASLLLASVGCWLLLAADGRSSSARPRTVRSCLSCPVVGWRVTLPRRADAVPYSAGYAPPRAEGHPHHLRQRCESSVCQPGCQPAFVCFTFTLFRHRIH